MTPRSENSVLTETLSTLSGHKIGVLTLNVPKAMNAIDLDMVKQLDAHLSAWHKDAKVVAVVMRGAGDQAFCAGGDIRKLYNSMQAQGDEQVQYADAFFTGEYSKNYRVSLFEKPIIAWGNGFVMGGGLGLFVGANHRVGTEKLKLAWPEIRIGLFPDVGATWYLSRLPYPVGHWMGLSGSHMNAVDCKAVKLTQYCLEHAQFNSVLEQLTEQAWQTNIAENHAKVRALLRSQEPAEATMPASELVQAQEDLSHLFKHSDLTAIDAAFKAYKGKNAWLKQGISNYLAGCPATAHVIMQQLKRGASMSLKEVVQWELELAFQAVRHPDFAEGIRAMVIDKDFKPQWQHKNIQAVPNSWVQKLTQYSWPEEHPFVDLTGWS